MIKHVVFLLFLCGIKNGYGSSISQEQTIESKDGPQIGIKKNEVGANGLEDNLDKITRNFQNPVLEYLLRKNSERINDSPQRGVVREIRHSQTLLVPNNLGSPLSGFFINQLPQFQYHKKPVEEETKKPDESPFENFWNFLKNKTQNGGNKIQENVVSSPVLHLNKNPHEIKEESTRIQMYPAVAVVINTFNKDGTLKNSVTHFQPDFNSIKADEQIAFKQPEEKNKNSKNINNSQYAINNFEGGQNSFFKGNNQLSRQGISWPLANYFPIVINDPFLSVYNAFATSMYNAVSSMVEYGPEADICTKQKNHEFENNNNDNPDGEKVLKQHQSRLNNEKIPEYLDRYRTEEPTETDSNIFDEVTMQSESFKRSNLNKKQNTQRLVSFGRKRRDATSIFVKSRDDDRVDITLEGPTGVNNGQKIPEETDLILRKGGIAIAGPGGAATAYTGGTAIVGPYGTVYKSPEGTAILGPFSKVVNITDDTSFEEILKMHKEMQSQNQMPTTPLLQQGGIGLKNYQNYFSYKTNLPIKFQVRPQGRSFIKTRPKILRLREEGIVKAIEEIKNTEFRRIIQDTPYEERMAKDNETTLIFRPKSKAEAGRNGVALSAPTSHAILYPDQKTNIYFEPESVASAGPSGFAHAHSDFELDSNIQDERARSFSQVLVNTPPLSTILRPPQQESRQFLGYADKKRKTKPSKPTKEEGNSEEIGEEHEEENTSQSQESANEAVAISPPPEGASVAEAKPIGLAIAGDFGIPGPGGVAASKPQGTAVAGPGGLAIARPVGTAIAGVDVEGSVPIGGQQKNKKKPKQEQEQTETDLHYVGGLTGPIGNPQPKEFADSVYYKTVKESEGNNLQDNFYLRGRPNTNTFQFKLGQQYGKYGLFPMFSNPVEGGEGRQVKRTDFPIFFHGLLGNNGQRYDQFQNYQTQF